MELNAFLKKQTVHTYLFIVFGRKFISERKLSLWNKYKKRCCCIYTFYKVLKKKISLILCTSYTLIWHFITYLFNVKRKSYIALYQCIRKYLNIYFFCRHFLSRNTVNYLQRNPYVCFFNSFVFNILTIGTRRFWHTSQRFSGSGSVTTISIK